MDNDEVKCLEELLKIHEIVDGCKCGEVTLDNLNSAISPYVNFIFNTGTIAEKLYALKLGYDAFNCAAAYQGYSGKEELRQLAIEHGFEFVGEEPKLNFDPVTFLYACEYEKASRKN